MERKRIIIGSTEILLSLLLTVGSLTFFRACNAEEGHFMNCHWAQNAVVLVGVVLTVISLLRLLIPYSDIGTGLALGLFALSVSAVFIPGKIINLCMMETMRCYTIFRPAVLAAASLIAFASGIDAVTGLLNRRKTKEGKK